MVAAFGIPVVLLAAAVVTAPTGPPELLVLAHNPLEPMDRGGYEKEVQRLVSRDDLVAVREWPAELSADAPVFLTELSESLVTLAIRGNATSGFELLVDSDANGKLDEPSISLEKNDDEWIATIRFLPKAATKAADRRAPSLVQPKWMQVSFRDPGERTWRLMVCRTNVRRGVVELAGRKTAFAITGVTGAYGHESLEIFFDLDGDGRLALDEPYSPERFTVQEERVAVGHTAYRFTIDPAGESITLTRLNGRFEPRTNLDFWAVGCAPCIWEMPKLAALRDEYRDRGFEILGILVGPRIPEIATICASKGADWPQLVDDEREAAGLYRVDRYPTTFLLDRRGRIIEHDLRGEKLEAAVKEALAP